MAAELRRVVRLSLPWWLEVPHHIPGGFRGGRSAAKGGAPAWYFREAEAEADENQETSGSSEVIFHKRLRT